MKQVRSWKELKKRYPFKQIARTMYMKELEAKHRKRYQQQALVLQLVREGATKEQVLEMLKTLKEV